MKQDWIVNREEELQLLKKKSDPFANFWFHFVRPNLRFLEAGKSDYVWKDKI